MKLGRYDSFMIGLTFAFSITAFVEGEYIIMATQGFILGLYFGLGYGWNRFVKGGKDE